jgi:hypothetical protein
MNKPKKKNYGWSRSTGFLDGSLEKMYYSDLEDWKSTRQKPGRKGWKEPHPDWLPWLGLFDPADKTKSQGSFARFIGVTTSRISHMKMQPITPATMEKLEAWKNQVYAGQG